MSRGRNGDETSSKLGLMGISSGDNTNPRSVEDRCSTRRIVKTQCKTEEAEPGIFIRKCEKTEQILKDCVGRPTEVISSTTEYTEDDVTNDMGRGSVTFGSSSAGDPFNFPGLRSDIEALEKGIFGGISGFLEAAEEMKNGFFQVFGTPHDIFKEEDDSSSSSSIFNRRIPIEGQLGNGTSQEQKKDDSVYSDFAGQFSIQRRRKKASYSAGGIDVDSNYNFSSHPNMSISSMNTDAAFVIMDLFSR